MAKVVQAFADNGGAIHPSAEKAVLADLSAILGRVGAEAGLTGGIAQLILDKRREIEQVWSEFDTMMAGGVK